MPPPCLACALLVLEGHGKGKGKEVSADENVKPPEKQEGEEPENPKGPQQDTEKEKGKEPENQNDPQQDTEKEKGKEPEKGKRKEPENDKGAEPEKGKEKEPEQEKGNDPEKKKEQGPMVWLPLPALRELQRRRIQRRVAERVRLLTPVITTKEARDLEVALDREHSMLDQKKHELKAEQDNRLL